MPGPRQGLQWHHASTRSVVARSGLGPWGQSGVNSAIRGVQARRTSLRHSKPLGLYRPHLRVLACLARWLFVGFSASYVLDPSHELSLFFLSSLIVLPSTKCCSLAVHEHYGRNGGPPRQCASKSWAGRRHHRLPVGSPSRGDYVQSSRFPLLTSEKVRCLEIQSSHST